MRPVPLILISVLAIASCGGSATKETTSSAPPPAPATSDTKSETKGFAADLACQQFFVELDTAMLYHLTVPANDSARGRLLAEGYRAALESLGKNDVVEELLAAAGDSISDCKPIQSAAAKLKDLFPDRNMLLLLYRATLDATLQKMDPFSRFDSKETGSNGSTWGAGIQFLYRTDYMLGRKPKYLVAEQFFDRSPNREVLGEGARIREIQLDPKTRKFWPVSEFAFHEATALLNQMSPSYEEIVVRAERPTGDGSFEPPAEVTLRFDRYVPHLARFRFLGEDEKVATIRLRSFGASTSAQDVKREWGIALREMKGVPEGLILDLRGNGGGLLSQAKVLLETLLPIRSPVGQIVAIVPPAEAPAGSKIGAKPSLVFPAEETDEDGEAIDVPNLIVLVDRGTASASEIVAAALRDFERAVIVGETTFGKGVGQLPFPIGAPLDGIAWVTSILFFSPNGESHQGRGIVPDIEIEDLVNTTQARASGKPTRMKEYPKQVVSPSIVEKAARDLDLPRIAPVEGAFRISPAGILELKEAAKAMQPPASCSARSAGDPKFREEDDCLLDWAHRLMRKRLEMTGTNPGSI